MPPLMILCGGMGTRLREVTELLPKPMVPIGEQPIVWHIMKSYAAFGVKRFILCLGYKRECFVDYFANYQLRTTDATIFPGRKNQLQFHGKSDESDWEITLAGTGVGSGTGSRVRIASKYLRDEDDCFFLTYGDGVSDIDIAAELEFHCSQKVELTVGAVHPAARFGEIRISQDNKVKSFVEKPSRVSGYINGGFMVMQKSFVSRFIPEEDCFLEQQPLHDAAAAGEMAAFRHEGFWQCMDTPREHTMLNDMWKENAAPWTKFWK
ncbi:MAG: NTP transferase domain-containing protein [Lentisphaeria bacterium]|nr:NTP transferase domain-containing protein [Lentisphaeria bacterium]